MWRTPSLFFLIFAIHSAFAIEVDNTTLRYEPLEDATTVMEAKINERLNFAISQVKGCDRDSLISAVRDEFFYPFYGSQMEFFAHEDASVPKLNLREGQNPIFANFEGASEKWAAYSTAPGLYASIAIAPLIRINGVMIGVDKPGHFFSMGYRYFTYGSVVTDEVLRYGEFTEKTYYGELVSGVYSYGDLAANMDGWRFWKNLTHAADGSGNNPHVQCENGKFQLARPFAFKDYSSEAWDEGINCSHYTDDIVTKIVRRTERELSKIAGKNYVCPADPQACKRIVTHYADLYGADVVKRIVSPECLTAATKLP